MKKGLVMSPFIDARGREVKLDDFADDQKAPPPEKRKACVTSVLAFERTKA